MAKNRVSRIWSEPHLRARTEQTILAFGDVNREQLASEINRLSSLHEYWLITRLLDSFDFGIPASATSAERPKSHALIRQLAVVGHSILTLNNRDFNNWKDNKQIPSTLRKKLRDLSWPNTPDESQRGALHSLLPTYEQLIEVIEILVVKGQVAMALSVLHLMIEYLPLLAWQQALGHAADPIQMSGYLSQAGVRWNHDSCPLNRSDRSAFGAVALANQSQRNWEKYLRDQHSRVASALTICGGVPHPQSEVNGQRICRNQCSVMTANSSLTWATVLIRRLRTSSIVKLRHDSPVGHFFAVPNEQEILLKWEATWEGLVADNPEAPAMENPLFGANRTGALPGLPQLLAVIAGRQVTEPIQASTLLSEVNSYIFKLTDSLN